MAPAVLEPRALEPSRQANAGPRPRSISLPEMPREAWDGDLAGLQPAKQRDAGHSWPPLSADKSREHRLEQIRLRGGRSAAESRALQLWVAARLLGDNGNIVRCQSVPCIEVPSLLVRCINFPQPKRQAVSVLSALSHSVR